MERELSRLVVSSRKACLGVNKPKFSSRLETFFVSSRKILENALWGRMPPKTGVMKRRSKLTLGKKWQISVFYDFFLYGTKMRKLTFIVTLIT